MTPEQKKVVLDYAAELQNNDQPWWRFEWLLDSGSWDSCTERVNPLTIQQLTFRRKPKTITVTMPVPSNIEISDINPHCAKLLFKTVMDCDTALAAIREAIGDE